MPDYVKAATEEEKSVSNNISSPLVDEKTGLNVMGVEDKVEVENVERPVDLYKVIFPTSIYECFCIDYFSL